MVKKLGFLLAGALLVVSTAFADDSVQALSTFGRFMNDTDDLQVADGINDLEQNVFSLGGGVANDWLRPYTASGGNLRGYLGLVNPFGFDVKVGIFANAFISANKVGTNRSLDGFVSAANIAVTNAAQPFTFAAGSVLEYSRFTNNLTYVAGVSVGIMDTIGVNFTRSVENGTDNAFTTKSKTYAGTGNVTSGAYEETFGTTTELKQSYNDKMVSNTLSGYMELGLPLYVGLTYAANGSYEKANTTEAYTSKDDLNPKGTSDHTKIDDQRYKFIGLTDTGVDLLFDGAMNAIELRGTIGVSLPPAGEKETYEANVMTGSTANDVAKWEAQETATGAGFVFGVAVAPKFEIEADKLSFAAKAQLAPQIVINNTSSTRVRSGSAYGSFYGPAGSKFEENQETKASRTAFNLDLAIPVGAEYELSRLITLRFGAEYRYRYNYTVNTDKGRTEKTKNTVLNPDGTDEGTVTETSTEYRERGKTFTSAHYGSFGAAAGFGLNFSENFVADFAISGLIGGQNIVMGLGILDPAKVTMQLAYRF